MRSVFLIIGCACLWISFAPGHSGQTDAGSAHADSTAIEADIDVIPEAGRLFDDLPDEDKGSGEMERLLDVHEKPFDLNKVTRAELETIPGITPVEAGEIISFRRMIGEFRSVHQLGVIEGNGEGILQKLVPFVYVQGKGDGGEEHVPLSVRFTSRNASALQPRRGFLDGTFSGTPTKSYNRVSLRRGANLDCSLHYGKDEGEGYSDGFVSGFVALYDWPPRSGIIIGDYTVDAGQGLSLWRQSSFGKTTAAVSLAKKSALGAQPYRSSGESGFLRGLAFTKKFDIKGSDLVCTAFFSSRSLSGTVDESGDVSGIDDDGLFRTQRELEKRNAVREWIVGGAARFTSEAGWELGTTFLHTSFSKQIVSPEAFGFSGTVNRIAGVDASVVFGTMTLFGEAARTHNGAGAGIVGAVCSAGRNCGLAMVYRDYSRWFQNDHAHGFGERDDTNNERGMYFALQVPLATWLRLSGYIDQYKFPWRTFSNVLPTKGREVRVEARGDFFQGFGLSMVYRNDHKEVTEGMEDGFARHTRQVDDRVQESFRLSASQKVHRRVRITGRIEATRVHYPLSGRDERGVLCYQTMQYSAAGIAAEARLIFFETESYDSRLYEYEADLRGVFANPPLSGKGQRWYFVLSLSPFRAIRISAKYVETRLEGVRSIGTGPMEISGDLDNRLSFQVDVKL